MNFQGLVPSFAICEKLKELGYPQNKSLFYWDDGDICLFNRAPDPAQQDCRDICAAPTIAEIFNLLPDSLDNSNNLTIIKTSKFLHIDYMSILPYTTDENLDRAIEGDKLPNALAEMWIYLKSNNLL